MTNSPQAEISPRIDLDFKTFLTTVLSSFATDLFQLQARSPHHCPLTDQECSAIKRWFDDLAGATAFLSYTLPGVTARTLQLRISQNTLQAYARFNDKGPVRRREHADLFHHEVKDNLSKAIRPRQFHWRAQVQNGALRAEFLAATRRTHELAEDLATTIAPGKFVTVERLLVLLGPDYVNQVAHGRAGSHRTGVNRLLSVPKVV